MRTLAVAAVAALLSVPLFASAETPDALANMISPISQPTLFEDPRQSTELRFIFAHHEFQDSFVTQGGDVQVYALQARFKITDDLSIIATKDGFVDLNPDAVVPSDTGLGNIAGGLKYTVHRDEESTVAVGLRYEAPTGDEEVLQGNGDGLINPFISGAWSLCGLNLMASTGMNQRFDSADSSIWDLNFHVDYPIGNFYPLFEVNLLHVYQSGERLPINDEGFDYFNLGSAGAAGNNILTAAVGGRYRVVDDLDLGVAYQFPIDRGDGARAIDWRLYADLTWRFNLS